MPEPAAPRLIGTALRCYPARWRRRHGDEALELAGQLISDGTPAGSIAVSYLGGAAREWLTPHAGRRMVTAACALLAACSISIAAGLLDPAAPARAASTSHQRGPAHCRPASPVPGPPPMSSPRSMSSPPTTLAAGRTHPTTREARHDQSC